ncbi:hypothetical protein M407DRAFT_111903 [Tulasnella calospora MUT 4182]|uniref:F-box domain-containing protein n=1 Tax=Tulasnella calospora MUT 4182 TaxID=1051891 RepID=A0A0C3LE68_9AGAM|nr:hypothetical protein M407DRAFT_111903 [Tulasnella calospora MUT 4182]
MTSIHSLPPELLHQIFRWVTDEGPLSASRPSWKNYLLTSGDGGEDPWPVLSIDMKGKHAASALRLTCSRWTALATECELRYIVIHRMRGLKYYLRRIRKLLQTGSEGGNKVACPVRIMNLRLLEGERGVWTEEDTEMVVSLIRECPNLEFMVNQCYAERETHAAGPIVLQSLANSCPKLKRLHWKPHIIMQVLPSSWSSILASSSLATSLEVLEIMSPPPAAGDEPTPVPALRLELPSLHCLQISVNEDNVSLVSVIAEEWQLPALKSLYLQYRDQSSYRGRNPRLTSNVTSLVSTHGQSVATLAIDRHTACNVPLHILPPAPIQELVYYYYGLREAESFPFTAVSTLVILIETRRQSHPSTKDVLRALKELHRLQGYNLSSLKTVVALSWAFDELKEPHPIDIRLLDETQRLWVEPWQQDAPRLVNRHGVRLFALVETNQDQS